MLNSAVIYIRGSMIMINECNDCIILRFIINVSGLDLWLSFNDIVNDKL
jgi:hypothetical protein